MTDAGGLAGVVLDGAWYIVRSQRGHDNEGGPGKEANHLVYARLPGRAGAGAIVQVLPQRVA